MSQTTPLKLYDKCEICPRRCGADRNITHGYCGGGANLRIARASLHRWEEPCVSGTNGSGTIFFSNCPLKCVYCQNYEISHENIGRDIPRERLGEIMLELKARGAHNINLVSPTQYLPHIAETLREIKSELNIPVIYNTGGYENVGSLKYLRGLIDVYLPDIKYFDAETAMRYSNAADYFEIVMKAVGEMVNQAGECVFDNGLIQKGVLIRHMILPNHRRESIKILREIARSFGDGVMVSLMSQYTPNDKLTGYPEINRKLCAFENSSVLEAARGLDIKGYTQERSSADKIYLPEFNCEGV